MVIPRREKCRGRLLGEFLVGLGLSFLVLTANMAILSSATGSSSRAQAENNALDIARNAVERLIAEPEAVRTTQAFEMDGVTLHRQVTLTPLTADLEGLSLASVQVDWQQAGKTRTVKLERYVPTR